MRNRDLDNALWVLLQLVRSAPLGGQYIVRAWLDPTRKEHSTRRLKFFTHAQLVRATQLAFERDYNRQFDLDVIEALPQNGRFPITFELPHEHANGEPVPMHMRCQVVLDAQGGGGFLDVDMDLWKSLATFEAADPRAISTPSAN